MYTLLVVDDNNRERIGISQLSLWSESGFDKILTAQNGKVGYEIAMREKPFLVVSDVSMPIMDGLEMAKKIHEKYPDTKFIFISCFDDSQYIRDAFDVDAFGYILKPININKLKNVVEKILKIDIINKEKDNVRKKLEKQITDNMEVVNEQITRDLLYGSLSKYEVSGLPNVQIKAFAAVLILRIDNSEKLSKDNSYAYIYAIKHIIEEFKSEKIRNSAFIQNRTSIGILAFADTALNEHDAISATVDCFNEIKEKINSGYDIEVSIFIGGVTENAEELHKLFRDAEYFMDYSMTEKNNSVILVENQFDNDDDLSYDINNIKDEISKILENGSIDDVNAFVDKYYTNTEVHAKKNIKNFTVCVMTALNLVLFEMNESFVDIFDNGFSVWEKLNDYNSILDIRQWVKNILKFTVEYINDKKTDRYAKIVKDIKSIIDEQYQEIENINQVSAQIYMSTVHANSVFKRETGQTIFDYLTKVRMEKAKLMLKEKNSRVYLVAESVGYKSKPYFASLFKEYTGMTPSEYRDKL